MIKVNDYIIVKDIGYNCICKVVSIGRNDTDVRAISVKMLYPNLGKEFYRIVVDVKKVKILDKNESLVVKDIYES